MIASVTSLIGVALFGIICTALGQRILRLIRLEFESSVEHLLCSVAAGVISFEAVLAVAVFAVRVRIAVIVALVAAAVLAGSEFQALREGLVVIGRRVRNRPRRELLLAAAVGLVLTFEGITVMAPVTGSDALRYHFAAPMFILQNGFHPDFFLVHSFFIGQGHLLILTGLALGSEKLSLGTIFLGGVLTASATACLARRWASPEWAWVAALSFLLTPVVFWQICSAGAPDVWMAFFTPLGVLVVARASANHRTSLALFGGILAGAQAGGKYTGCIIAASLAIAFLWETRSVSRMAVFFCGALGAGVWPYARNLLWAGDPVFPFLLRWFAPERINSFTLASTLADTGATGPKSLLQVAEFPFFAAVDPSNLGFWQFWGPLCLAFVPLIVLAVRNTSLWRAALITWLLGSVGIGTMSGSPRFLLPVFPIALAAVFAGVAALRGCRWPYARAVSIATIVGFLLAGAAGLAAYGSAAAAAAVGLTSREAYLGQRAPDYGRVGFVNQILRGREREGKALVFFQHTYYLDVPFVGGNPDASWNIDPERLRTPEAWLTFFHAENIRWVIRAPDYPLAIASPLERLEENGNLAPIARGQVSDFEGMRLAGSRTVKAVAILRVKD